MDRFETLIQMLRRRVPGLELREQEPMSRHTSFRIGGPVRLMALPRSEEEAAQAVRAAAELELPPFFMGNGSNLLVADQGAEVFVVKTFDGLNRLETDGAGGVTAGSGVLLSRLANFALANSLTGLEFAHGIPGSLGGAVTMNAGAYDGEMKEVVVSTVCLTASGGWSRYGGRRRTSPTGAPPFRTAVA